MAEPDRNSNSYTLPSNTILEYRKLFYTLKRETNEGTQTWLSRIQWYINRCEFPKIIEFLLIDKFMCELHFNEVEFIRRIETWTLSQLYEYFVDEKIDDDQGANDDKNEMDDESIDSNEEKSTENFGIDSWAASNETEIDDSNEMPSDDMICKVVSIHLWLYSQLNVEYCVILSKFSGKRGISRSQSR